MYDKCLSQSGTVTLKPWQQEIRNHVIVAKKPTFFAQHKLVRWGKLKRLVVRWRVRIARPARSGRSLCLTKSTALKPIP
jgi:hypothetical protein